MARFTSSLSRNSGLAIAVRNCSILILLCLAAFGPALADTPLHDSDDSDTVTQGPESGTRSGSGSLPWTVISPVPIPVSRPASAVVDGLFYIVGGEESGGVRAGPVQVYDAELDVWDEDSIDPMPVPASNLCAAASDGLIYVPGGTPSTSVQSDVLRILDTATGTWTEASDDPLPEVRSAPACAWQAGKLFVFGGFTSDSGVTVFTDTAWVYDPQSPAGSRWSTLTASPFEHAYGSAVAADNGLIFVTGFRDATTPDFATVAAYDPDADEWLAYPDLQDPRGGAGVWLVGDTLYVGGGGWSSYLTSVERYDLSQGATGSWEFVAPLNVGRRTFAAGTDSDTGRLFLGAGWAGAFLDSAEVQLPSLILGDVTTVDRCAAVPASENGFIEPGERVELTIPLSAPTRAFDNVVGMLSSSSPGVSIISGTANYGDIPLGASASADFSIRVSEAAICFDTIELTLAASSDEGSLDFQIDRTIGQVTQDYDELPLDIPDGDPSGVSSTAEISGIPAPLTDVQVQVNAPHTYVGDLIITLTSPEGTTVTLLDRPGVPVSSPFGCGNNDVDVRFADDEPDPENVCTNDTADSWPVTAASPVTPLSSFDGEDGNGTWTLTISDNAGGDDGTLEDWSLILTPEPEPICSICPSVADVSITKTADAPDPLLIGDTITYTLVAANVGPSQAQQVVVSDTLPNNVSYVSNDCGANFAAPDLTWDIGLLDADDDATCTLTVTASDIGEISNTATISTGSDDSEPDNNADTVVLAGVAPPADLSISKDDGVDDALPGESVTYTIVASNAGPGDALNSTVTDNFPTACTSVDWTCQGADGGSCVAAGSGDIDENVDLPAGGSVTFSAVCDINTAATGTLSNTATVQPPAGVEDPEPDNNSATDVDNLTSTADLALAKTATGVPDPLQVGSSFQYLLSASNAGPSQAQNVVVTDPLPASLNYVSNDCGATFAAPLLSWDIGTLAAGATAECSLTVSVIASGDIVNTADITSSSSDPDTSNNASSSQLASEILAVPTLGTWALLILALGVMLVVLRHQWASRRQPSK